MSTEYGDDGHDIRYWHTLVRSRRVLGVGTTNVRRPDELIKRRESTGIFFRLLYLTNFDKSHDRLRSLRFVLFYSVQYLLLCYVWIKNNEPKA